MCKKRSRAKYTSSCITLCLLSQLDSTMMNREERNPRTFLEVVLMNPRRAVPVRWSIRRVGPMNFRKRPGSSRGPFPLPVVKRNPRIHGSTLKFTVRITNTNNVNVLNIYT